MYTPTTQFYSPSIAPISLQLNTWVCWYLHPHDQAPPYKLWYVTRISYIFPKNSSLYQHRRTWIPARLCSDFLYVSTQKNWQVHFLPPAACGKMADQAQEKASALAWQQEYFFTSQYPSLIKCERLHIHLWTFSALNRSTNDPRIAMQTCIYCRVTILRKPTRNAHKKCKVIRVTYNIFLLCLILKLSPYSFIGSASSFF